MLFFHTSQKHCLSFQEGKNTGEYDWQSRNQLLHRMYPGMDRDSEVECMPMTESSQSLLGTLVGIQYMGHHAYLVRIRKMRYFLSYDILRPAHKEMYYIYLLVLFL